MSQERTQKNTTTIPMAMINYTTHTALSTSNGCVELRKYFDGSYSAYHKDKHGNVKEVMCAKFGKAQDEYDKLKLEL